MKNERCALSRPMVIMLGYFLHEGAAGSCNVAWEALWKDVATLRFNKSTWRRKDWVRGRLKGRRRFSILQINFVNYNAFCTVFSAFSIPCRYSKWGMLCSRLRALQYLLPYRSSRLTTSICLVVNAFNSPDLKSFNLSTHQIKFDMKVPQSRYGLGATPTVFSGWSKL